MCHMKADVAFFEYLEVAYVTLMLILHSLSIVSIFVSHIGCFGCEYLEMKLYKSQEGWFCNCCIN